MGKNAPLQAEGTVGDITVRDVTSVGLRCYIKTDSGWFDINSLIKSFRINWIDMNLDSSWEENTASAEAPKGTPQYCKDQNGFVHFRGGAISGTAFGATITTLPGGFRPNKPVYKLTTRTGLVTNLQVIRITEVGVVNVVSQRKLDASSSLVWDAAEGEVSADATVGVNLEGISFFAQQKITSIGAGSTVTQEQFPGGFPVQ